MPKWLRRRRSKENNKQQAQHLYELREFIYLDEVSVTSLLSSREGSIPQEFTDSAGSSSKAEISGEVGADVALFKNKIGSRYESARSVNSQVVSKATVQTLFKRLVDIEKEHLALRSPHLSDELPNEGDIHRLLAENETDFANRRWVTPINSLRRGELVELDVELEADEIFELSTIVATFKELTDQHEDLRAQLGRAEIDDLSSINKLIEKMMVGLIPLKCHVTDYVVVGDGHKRKLVHRSIYDTLPQHHRPSSNPVYLVGDTEQSLFWKDIRRVLFSGSRFRMFCRLSGDGLSDTWNPLKLLNTVKRADPDLGSRVASFATESVKAMSGSKIASEVDDRRGKALQHYGHLLAHKLGLTLSESDQSTLTSLARSLQDRFTSALEAGAVFKQIQEFVETLTVRTLEPAVESRLREEACELNGLLPDGSSIQPERERPTANPPGTPRNLLEVEIIAIYW